jgi:hypothetical protein
MKTKPEKACVFFKNDTAVLASARKMLDILKTPFA